MKEPPLNMQKKTGYYGLNIVPSLDQAIGSLKKPLGIPIPNIYLMPLVIFQTFLNPTFLIFFFNLQNRIYSLQIFNSR
jgi:hypothetical protein